MNKFKQLTSIIGCTILLLILLVYWTPSAGATPDDSAGGTISSPNERVLRYRPNVNELREDQKQALKDAVRYMQRLPEHDPRSWKFQANIHGHYVSPGEMTSDLWNTCQHGNHYFLPWHRAYLYHFEEILREVAKEGAVEDCKNNHELPDCDNPGEKYSDLTVPYWNYDDGDLEIPEIFRIGPECTDWTDDKECNPLYVSNRDSDMNSEDGPAPLSLDDPKKGLGRTDYCHGLKRSKPEECPRGLGMMSFGGNYANELSLDPFALDTFVGKGELEVNPHDLVHSAVGGRTTKDIILDMIFHRQDSCDPIPWMSDPKCSARDPIFWIHHANIDRMWAKWNNGTDDSQGSRPPRENPDNIWNNQKIHFVGKDGDNLGYKISQFALEDTRCYGYTYEESEKDHPIPDSCPEILPISIDPMTMKGRIRRGQSEEIQDGIMTVLERISQNLNRLNRLEEGRSVKIGVDIKTKVLEKLKQEGPAVLKEGPAVLLKIKNVHYLPGSPIYRVNITKNNGENKEFVGFISLFGFPQGADLKFELGEKLKAMIDNGLQVELEEFDPVERKVNPTLPLKLDRMPTLPLKLDGMPTIDEIPMIGFDSVEIEAIE
jgi:hypothetical protein